MALRGVYYLTGSDDDPVISSGSLHGAWSHTGHRDMCPLSEARLDTGLRWAHFAAEVMRLIGSKFAVRGHW